MANAVIQGPPAFYVSWGCRRCGHTGGLAKTTFPVNPDWTEPMMRELLTSLRRKLVTIHARQGCFASVEDFVIGRGKPADAEIVGLV